MHAETARAELARRFLSAQIRRRNDIGTLCAFELKV